MRSFNRVIILAPLTFLFIALVLNPSPVMATAAKDRVKQMVKEARASVPEISAKELKELMDKEENLLLIDVRVPGEYLSGHIQGAKLMPRGLLEWTLPGKYKDSDAPIVFYCLVGARSALAAKLAKDLGYSNVKNFRGGLKEWKKAGYKVQK